MTPSDDVHIVKIPLSESAGRSAVGGDDDSADSAAEDPNKRYYGRMPVMYLEFIENKSRVLPEILKPQLVRKATQSSHQPTTTTTIQHRPTTASSANVSARSQQTNEPSTSAGRQAMMGVDATAAAVADQPRHHPHQSSDDSGRESSSATTAAATDHPPPPTFEELKAQGVVVNHDTGGGAGFSSGRRGVINGELLVTQFDDEDVMREREELNFRCQVLKRMHPNADIPEMTIYSDPKIMAQKYRMLEKRLSLDSSVESWKRYMIIAILGTECLLGKLKFDMDGFSQQQIASMNTYDALLVELAEKTYVPEASKWPVELRLFAMMLVNVVLFSVSKVIEKKTGFNVSASILGSLSKMVVAQQNQPGGSGGSVNYSTAFKPGPASSYGVAHQGPGDVSAMMSEGVTLGASATQGTISSDRIMRGP